jgi:hypothetical protein
MKLRSADAEQPEKEKVGAQHSPSTRSSSQ